MKAKCNVVILLECRKYLPARFVNIRKFAKYICVWKYLSVTAIIYSFEKKQVFIQLTYVSKVMTELFSEKEQNDGREEMLSV